MEEQIWAAAVDDLKRQAEAEGDLQARQDGDRLVVDGPIGIGATVTAVAGSVAGGL